MMMEEKNGTKEQPDVHSTASELFSYVYELGSAHRQQSPLCCSAVRFGPLQRGEGGRRSGEGDGLGLLP